MLTRTRKFTLASLLVGCFPAFCTTVYVSASDDNLYTINPATGVTTLVGNTGVEMADIAFNAGGSLFGVSFPPSGDSSLYSINPDTGASTKIGTDTGYFLNALQFGPNGTLYAAGGAPGCGPPPQTACNAFFTVDTTTGLATPIGTGSYESSGDLEFVGSTLYLTSRTSTTDQLFSINPATGAGTLIGDTTFAQIFGLAYVAEDHTLFGFNDVGNNVIAINTTTGAAVPVANYSSSFEILGAATVPEPRWSSLFIFLALGGVLTVRKRLLTWGGVGVHNRCTLNK